MPPSWDSVAWLAELPDIALSGHTNFGDSTQVTMQFVLYDLLRHEQALALSPGWRERPEIGRILDLAHSAYGDLVGLLIGRPDELLDSARDGEWSLRDLLRHAIAVELRYAAQVDWATRREDDQPIQIPDDRLPGDRLNPPDPEYADSRQAGLHGVMRLLEAARLATGRRLETITDDALDRPSIWGKFQLSARMRAHQIGVHLSEVTIQAEKMLGADTSSEVRRILRRCCAARGSHELWSDPGSRRDLDIRYIALKPD